VPDRASIHAAGVFAVYEAPEGNTVALRGVDLTIAPGEIVTITGPSGSGKTTLLDCLGAFRRPTAGSLLAFGIRLHDAPSRELARFRAQTVGIVAQHYFRALSPDLPVRDLVTVKPAMLGWSRAARSARATELLERVGLADRADARRHELSGGEQQRIAICAALAAHPRLLLADEPTGELDADTGQSILTLIAELARDQDATAILATHDPAANQIADRTVALRDGRIVAERTPPDADERLVVDPSGLLRLDPSHRQAAGITTRAHAHTTTDGLFLTGDGDHRGPNAQQPDDVAPAPPAQSSDVVAQIGDVEHVYHSDGHAIQALGPLTHSFPAGRLHIVSGPSGSGKTTLLQLLAGLERPTRGRILIGDQDLNQLDRTQLAHLRRRELALVAQSPPLTEFLTARENAELPQRIRGHPAERAHRDADDALAAVGLHDTANQRADTLSGGQRARLALARALASHPRVLLIDEPTASLDQANAANIAQLMRRLTAERQMTIICATHDPIVAHHGDDHLDLRPRRDQHVARSG
jgi:peptide/nickel transport system ATP-binding protein